MLSFLIFIQKTKFLWNVGLRCCYAKFLIVIIAVHISEARKTQTEKIVAKALACIRRLITFSCVFEEKKLNKYIKAIFLFYF